MPQDIILDDGYDLVVEKGDFIADESTYQHQALLMLSNKGEFKQYPTRCIGANNYLEMGKKEEFTREVSSEFVRDGMHIYKLNINIPKIEIDARYEES